MEAKAYLRYARISPQKVRFVLDQIRGKDAKMARSILLHSPKAASEPLIKLLDSAIANGENNNSMRREDMFVSECFVCQGPTLKRIRPRARGSAFRIDKRTSHITVVLKEREN